MLAQIKIRHLGKYYLLNAYDASGKLLYASQHVILSTVQKLINTKMIIEEDKISNFLIADGVTPGFHKELMYLGHTDAHEDFVNYNLDGRKLIFCVAAIVVIFNHLPKTIYFKKL